MAISNSQQTSILKVVAGLFNAAPGGSNLTELANLVEGGTSIQQLARDLAKHPLFTDGIMAGKATTPAQVGVLMNHFGLTTGSGDASSPDAQAEAFFTARINEGTGFGDIVFEAITFLSQSNVPAEFADVAALLDNKVLVAEVYSENNSATDLATLQSILIGVTATGPATRDEAITFLEGQGTGPNAGQVFTLTSAVDNIAGTSGDDAINGVVDTTANGAGGTFTPGDQIDGGAGNDTATFVITDTGKWSNGATIKNVENIVFRDVTNKGDTVNVANINGATSFTNLSSTAGQTLTLNNIQSNAKLAITNSSTAGGTANSLTANFKDGIFVTGGSTLSADFNAAGSSVAGTTVRSDLTVGHASAAGTATDLTLALNASGTNFATFTNGANSIGGLKTLSVGGTGSLDIVAAGAEFNNLTTVNAAANKGGFKVDLAANNKDVTFTGGEGNDTLTLLNFNTKDSVDGGAGNDTLNVTLADVQAFTKAAPVSNVETLGITLGAGPLNDTSVNGDFFGINNITLNDGPNLANKSTLSFTNLAHDANVTFKASSASATGSTGTISVDVKGAIAGTEEAATLTFGKGVNFTDDGITGAVKVNAAGLETVTLATAATAGAGAQLSELADAQLKALNVTGSDGITVGSLANAKNINTVDASAVVKDSNGNVGGVTVDLVNNSTGVIFTGGEGADTYTASTKGDAITGGLGGDIVTLGTGADKLVYNVADDSKAGTQDVVGGFDTTADVVQFAAALQVGTAAYIGAAAFTNTGATQLRMNGADLEVDLNGDTTADMTITLTGVGAGDFGAANFVFA
ncbi:hypothetical protein SAMN05216419_1002122 [Nitrosomonas cryotolerans]|uniref:Hemolysin-type calcium-binding repeat-containing protein n=1 Tax=Nitrosomonas cryotolerans ATCC 49181 TaxID=1131553 RepID=A0A1N6GXI6_9PROT|nr:hypothetical protein [Nitrosomonas cryotolerans]SFP42285.1 hypothetical protein SAMN05216419_1002122 [Nitrosomonas cryotolerans]SIO12239.1 hypothetical protein SAMN02743940_0916 [Nitrosomonas cryotolerans ATCC 49181]